MNKNDQVRIAIDLCQSLKDEIIKRVPHIPENWDGHEIREWIGDFFKQHYAYSDSLLQKKRKADYKRELVNNRNII